MKSKMPFSKSTHGFVRSHLVGLLAGIGLASIAIFGRNTVESAMSFVKEMRKDGYATTASARVSVSEINSGRNPSLPLPLQSFLMKHRPSHLSSSHPSDKNRCAIQKLPFIRIPRKQAKYPPRPPRQPPRQLPNRHSMQTTLRRRFTTTSHPFSPAIFPTSFSNPGTASTQAPRSPRASRSRPSVPLRSSAPRPWAF